MRMPMLCAWIFLIAMVGNVASAQESAVSRRPPADWEVFRQRLVPLEQALELPAVPRPPSRRAPEVEVILKHRYVRVRADGKALRVSHQVEKLLEESGREQFSSRRIEFRPSHESIHVAAARTLTPEGNSVEVSEDGVFLEQPKNESDSLFTDIRAVRIVFPDTRPGSVVEWITVEEVNPLIPDHWSGGTYWGDVSPVRSLRYVAEFPTSVAGNVVWDGIGVEPVPTSEEIEGGWTRRTWEARDLPAPALEVAMPSVRQRGPWLRIGSGENWDRFGLWFANGVSEASRESEGPETVSDDWAVNAASPRETAEKLFEKVSREIRYTGLEFGKGAFQPRPPREVLETRYGDCKDKSNLLKNLLGRHGIPSRLALLHTSLPGEISRKIASTSLFDHAILAVDLPGEEGPVFCDPTLDGVPFGFVSERDEGKDVLIIGDGGELEWATIPRTGPSRVGMSADATIEPSGAYSGWFEVRASGAEGWRLRRHFEKISSRAKKMEFARDWFFRFVHGRIVMDGEALEGDAEFPFRYRFYLLQDPITVQASEKTASIHLPAVNQVITQLGPEGQRSHAYVATPVACDIEVRFDVSDSWEILDRAADYSAVREGIEISSAWKDRDSRLVAEVKMHRTLPEFSPRQFNALSESVKGLASHLSAPLLLLRKGEEAGNAVDPATLPKMPSSEGFADLINKRYPFAPHNPWKADHSSRAQAFERMRELYPKEDREGQFTAGLMLALSRLFLSEDQEECRTIAEETRELITGYGSEIDPDKSMSAELLLATALLAAGETDAAREICAGVLANEGGPKILLKAAAAMMANLVFDEDASRCAELAKTALDNELLPDDEWADLVSIYLAALARLGSSENANDLFAAMEWAQSLRPDLSESFKDEVLTVPFRLVSSGYHEAAGWFRDRLFQQAESLGIDEEERSELAAYFEAIEKVGPLYSRLKSHLAESPWPDLEKIENDDSIENAEDCLDVYHDDISVELRYILRGMVRYGPQHDFMDRIAEFFTSSIRWFEEAADAESPPAPAKDDVEAILDLLLVLWREAPEEDDATVEDALVAEGSLIARREGAAAAVDFFEKMADDSTIASRARFLSVRGLSDLRSSERDIAGYLAALRKFETFMDFRWWRDASITEGAYLSLLHGARDEAWRRIGLIASEDGSEDAEYPDGVGKIALAWTADTAAAERWWDAGETWWPEWESLANRLDLEMLSEEPWEDYDPWVPVPPKQIEELTGERKGENRERRLKQALAKQTEFTRWHRDGAESLLLLLREGAASFPDDADAFARLAGKVKDAISKENESAKGNHP